MKQNPLNMGGKANSLIRLKENNFNVPKFFVIGSDKFKEFLSENNLNEKIKNCIDTKDFKKIKQLILSCNFNERLKSMINDNFNTLNLSKVAVRSSAEGEDGKEKSFAGQYNTYLNVKYSELYEKIKLCWCSLLEENVLAYSDLQNLYGMNVIIQEMVEADFAGVAFSVDTLSDTNNYSVIEMVSGLGEKLVSGKKIPTKFLVRRKTHHIDLKIGNLDIEKDIVTKLEQIILGIEKLYGRFVDVEYAIKNNVIYILQARPITATTPKKKNFSLSLSRPHSILEQEVYFEGEYKGISALTENLYYFKPLFIYNKENENVNIYYNFDDLEEDPNMIYYTLNLNFENTLREYEKILSNIEYLNDIIDNRRDIDIDNYIRKIIEIYPFISLGQLAGHFENITPKLKNILIEFRNNYDYIIHKALDYIKLYFEKDMPQNYRKYIDFMQLSELRDCNYPDIEELEKRIQGYIYFENLYTTSKYDVWLQENNINILQEDNHLTLKGEVVFSKDVEGRVCKIFSEKDLEKFEEGDILVTPMTVPKFISIIKRAKAIVADEGGTTCHAAIIARELKIPCVVGCKNATQILKDGDIIQINGSTGKIAKV